MKKRKLHVISGTHWDREWRHTAEQSKLRLVDLMDNIINILENNNDYKYFCVDGGMIVLEDYLSIRPENKERIKKLIKAKKMSVVNWYTLPEMNTVAPEALVRNLLLGHKMSREFGGGMKSGYTATSYGQHSQMPQLYRGFNIDTAIFYRGTNKHVLTPLFIWEGADGSRLDTLRTFDEVTRTNWFFYVHGPVVLGKAEKDLSYTYDRGQQPTHMADIFSYEKGFTLLKEEFDYNHDKAAQKKAFDSLMKQAEPYQIGEHILALNMEDNDEPYKFLPELIKDMNGISGDVEIIQNTLDDYMDAIRSDKTRVKSAIHKGELRYTTAEHGNFNALLGATHSSRVKIKLANEDTETNLIHLAEPLASIASLYGKEYPAANLDRAWEALLKNHAHDSICGAAVDKAHEDMVYNFSIAKTVAEEVANRSAIGLFSKIDTLKDFNPSDNVITLYNTLPYARKEIVQLVLDTPAFESKKAVAGEGADGAGQFYDIVDAKGHIIPYTEISCDDSYIGVERELDTKAIKFKATRRRVLVEAEIPALGYVTYAMRFRAANYVFNPEIGENRKLLAREEGILENEYIRVNINHNGTFSLLNKETGYFTDNLHYFTDSGETGSAHISGSPKRNHVVTSIGGAARVTMLESNLHRGVFKLETEIQVPAQASLDTNERDRRLVTIPITTTLTLEKDARVLKIKTKLRNEARDHKLSVCFPTGITADFARSESAWATEKRSIKWADHKDNFENFFAFQPMQNFVDVSDGKNGFAILNKGLREYEVCDDVKRTVKITLLRTHRAYMTANAIMTPEELDQYPGQHSFGDIEYNYAIYVYGGKNAPDRALQQAYEFKVPVKAVLGVPASGELPASGSFIAINPSEKIMLSAIKTAEDGSGIVLRLWNSTSETLGMKAVLNIPVASVQRLQMNEEFIEDIALQNGVLEYKMLPHKIETFLLKK